MTGDSGLQMDLHKSAEPLRFFETGGTQIDKSVKETCFIRYVGMESSEIAYISLLKRLDRLPGGYYRTDGLRKDFTPEQIDRAGQEGAGLEKAVFQFQDTLMEQTRRRAFMAVMDTYRTHTPQASASMERNFRVKLICWMEWYLPRLYQKTQKPDVFPHFVYVGDAKRQDYLFFYFLYLTGCHVLYMNPVRDVEGVEQELKALSFLYEKPCQELVHCQIPPYGENSAGAAGRPKINISLADRGTGTPQHHQSGASSAGQTSGVSEQHQADNVRPVRQPSGGYPSSGQDRQAQSAGHPAHPAPGAPVVVRIPRRPGRPQQEQVPMPGAAAARETECVRTEAVSAAGPSAIRQGSPASGAGGLRKLEYEELARLSSSVVMIKVYDQNRQCFKTGSGVVISREGYILTNFHVVSGGVSFGVRFENEEQETMTYALIKYHTAFDLALLRVERPCVPIVLAPPNPLVRGQKIVAIGSPLGLFNTVSDGIVSGFRKIDQVSMVQFTAPISRGSSGGALLDLYGRLTGIITAGYDDGQNLNLAVDRETLFPFIRNFIHS